MTKRSSLDWGEPIVLSGSQRRLEDLGVGPKNQGDVAIASALRVVEKHLWPSHELLF